eukprot:CAMPEP_0196805612 /NCGR_PEP_ID=MMETSP1362-20130617/5405_1 /TAXON_ID=163516 /ORGANISM="Leptocylindrus danicus, Strain CCMP1856" /LENGTH=396 /DNA_ID=CAMNT_0042178641 /DNA_START=6 /DNA_END=1196 /DNA_ORIENTATION=-
MTDSKPHPRNRPNKSKTSTKPKFEPRDKAFSLDHDASPPLLYEVVIRTAQRGPRSSHPTTSTIADDGTDTDWCWWYFLHFQGWNTKWDKWVEEDMLVEDSPENRELCKSRMKAARSKKKNKKARLDEQVKELKQKKEEEKKAAKKAVKEAAEMAAELKRKKKEEAEAASEGAAKHARYLLENDLEDFSARSDVQHVQIPFTLKKVLIDEYERITVETVALNGYPQRMVADLPATISIKTVLERYKEVKLGSCKGTYAEASKKGWEVMVNGLLSFFNESLSLFCLYRHEKPQFRSIISMADNSDERFAGKEYCEIYGCEFLLRLIVRLPVLLVDYRASPLAAKEMKNIVSKLGDLTRYLQKNQNEFFRQPYRIPLETELMDCELKALKKKNGKRVKA